MSSEFESIKQGLLEAIEYAKGNALKSGDHLPLAEFKHRYANNPQICRAELIDNVVHIANPRTLLPHSTTLARIIGLLGTYHSHNPDINLTGEISVELDDKTEVQPDALLWRDSDVKIVNEMVLGAPTLIVEVSDESRAYDLGIKKQVY